MPRLKSTEPADAGANWTRAVAAGLLLALSACSPGEEQPPLVSLVSPVRVSGATPFAAGCNGAPQSGAVHAGAEVEPSLAIDPLDPAHLVAAWQQDRWTNGGANGLLTAVSRDGGRTWTRGSAPFSRCTGGTAGNGGDYDRATDPWLSFAADGTMYQSALVFDDAHGRGRKAVLVSRSTDGGERWSAPVALASDSDPAFGLDKETVTADPGDALVVYAVWDRLTRQTDPDKTSATGPAWFARSTDGGRSWEPARAIYDPGADAQTISNQIVVLRDGTLVNLFVILLKASSETPDGTIAILRSSDKGASWSQPIPVAALLSVGTVDRKGGTAVRSGAVVPSIALDPSTGALYVAWQDARFSSGARDGIALAHSADGGLTWSAPVQVNRAPAAQAFTPAVAVAKSGRVAVAYYDFRADDPNDSSRLLTSVWRASSIDGGRTWNEVLLGGPFNLRDAPRAGGAFFLGDYVAQVGGGDDFTSLFVMSGSGSTGQTDVYAERSGVVVR